MGAAHVDVAKLVDAADLKSASRQGVRVQVPPSAPFALVRRMRPMSHRRDGDGPRRAEALYTFRLQQDHINV